MAELRDNKIGNPLAHYRALFAAGEPGEMAERSGAAFADGAFALTLLGRAVSVSWPEMRIAYADGQEASGYAQILLARYLLGGRLTPSSGMRSYAEMPWGEVYLRQFTGRCVSRLAFGFGNSPEKFSQACRALGGVPVTGGDAAYDVPLLPGFVLRLIIWSGDDEFPPSAQILFSDNFPAAFTAEDMAVAGDLLLNALTGLRPEANRVTAL